MQIIFLRYRPRTLPILCIPKRIFMLKKILFTGIFIGCSLIASSQSVTSIGDDTPPDFERAYEQLLSKRQIDNQQLNFSDQTIFFDDSTYIKRLHSLPTQMELVFNPAVRQQIELYAGKRKNQVSYMLGEGKYYFPIFEAALDKEQLPLELKYLPVIESALNPIARSRVGASGLWQFMAPTGKMYDLEINSLVDERFDPLKSTDAAVKYLKDLYSKYGDWNLVIAAYNCGPGNVDKAIRRSGGLTDYWTIYPYLPKETRGYVPIFIAATYIMNYHQEHNITSSVGSKPSSMDSVMICKNLHFQQISDMLNIQIEDLRKYNPQFKTDMIPGDYKPYALNLPKHNLMAFIDNEDSIFIHRANELFTHRRVAGLDVTGSSPMNTKKITHRVKSGETLTKLANKYGVTTSQIKKWNGLRSNKISAGKRLSIHQAVPVKRVDLASNSSTEIEGKYTGEPIRKEEDKKKTKAQAVTSTTYYKVKKGDTWAKISKRNNASIADIKSWNKIKNNKLVAGKQLKIQKTTFIEIAEEVVEEQKLPEPKLATIEIDSTFTIDIFDHYMKKMEDDGTSLLPRVRLLSSDNNDDRIKSDDTRIIYHKVKIGETITQIATRYNVSQKDIQTWNKLSSGAKVGQRLLIRLPEGEYTPSNDSSSYNVERSVSQNNDSSLL